MDRPEHRLPGGKHVLIPLEGATSYQDGIKVSFPKDQIKDAPGFEGDEVPEQTEFEIYQYYGLRPSERPSPSTLPEGRQQPTGQQTITRSEEELRVGKREVPAGTVRLRKSVESEPVHEQVELRRETADVQRQPVNRPASGAQLGEEEVDVELTREEPVVQKQAVAREEISVQKGQETTTESVDEELRKERVDVEGGHERTRR